MKRIVEAKTEERANLFRLCSQAKGIPYSMVEKDFWVCWVLARLFNDSTLRNLLRFKGGMAGVGRHGGRGAAWRVWLSFTCRLTTPNVGVAFV